MGDSQKTLSQGKEFKRECLSKVVHYIYMLLCATQSLCWSLIIIIHTQELTNGKKTYTLTVIVHLQTVFWPTMIPIFKDNNMYFTWRPLFCMALDHTLLPKHSWLSCKSLKFSESLSQQLQDCPLISWPCHQPCSQSCSCVYRNICGGHSRHFHICIQTLTRRK